MKTFNNDIDSNTEEFGAVWQREMPRAMRMRYESEIKNPENLNRDGGKSPLFSVKITGIEERTKILVVGFLLHATENFQHLNLLYGNAVPGDAGILLIECEVSPQNPIIEFTVNDLQILAINKRLSQDSAAEHRAHLNQLRKEEILKKVDQKFGTTLHIDYPVNLQNRASNALRLGLAIVRQSDSRTLYLFSKSLYYMKYSTSEIKRVHEDKGDLVINFGGHSVPKNGKVRVVMTAIKSDRMTHVVSSELRKGHDAKQSWEFKLKNFRSMMKMNSESSSKKLGPIAIRFTIYVEIQQDNWTESSDYVVSHDTRNFKWVLQQNEENISNQLASWTTVTKKQLETITESRRDFSPHDVKPEFKPSCAFESSTWFGKTVCMVEPVKSETDDVKAANLPDLAPCILSPPPEGCAQNFSLPVDDQWDSVVADCLADLNFFSPGYLFEHNFSSPYSFSEFGNEEPNFSQIKMQDLALNSDLFDDIEMDTETSFSTSFSSPRAMDDLEWVQTVEYLNQ